MRIELLDETNRSLLDHIAEDVFDHPMNESSVTDFIQCPRHTLALAVEDDVVIGMASGFEYFHPDKKRQFFINEIGVTPVHQRKGIGRRLIRFLLDHAIRLGCCYAWLGTETTNIAGNKCFSSVTGVGAPQDFVFYEWQLGPSDEAT